ncbi:hypothetical protein K1719_035970 [Acacia pycnantha]|nr:hypothetical protein K1719_037297 [Acacia pycnantha]KAI9082045.1 hypothetical protein K1719_035970 [Acacia pycnantha]
MEKHVIDGRTVEAKKAVPRDDQNISNRSNSSIHGSPGPTRTKKIFVGGLASTITESDFKKYFDQFGTITDVVVIWLRLSGPFLLANGEKAKVEKDQKTHSVKVEKTDRNGTPNSEYGKELVSAVRSEKVVSPANVKVERIARDEKPASGVKKASSSEKDIMRKWPLNIDMLQKLLVEQGEFEENTTSTGADKMDHGDKVSIKPKLANSSSHLDINGSDDAGSDPLNEIKDECSDASLDQINQE